MLKKAKKSHIGTRITAWALACMMILSLVGVMPEPIWAEDEVVTSWDFTQFTDSYEGKSGEWNTLVIDATNGKFKANGNSAQFNAGTILKVPVTGACDVNVTGYSGYINYEINGTEASTTDTVTTVEYTGGAGYVEIVSTGSSYIVSIELTYKEVAGATEKVFDAADVPVAAKGAMPAGSSYEYGDFTILGHDNMVVENKAVSFSDGYTSTNRLALGGTLSTSKGAIMFTTSSEAEVTVYWVSGGNDREIKIVDASGNEAAITSEGSVKNTQYISTLSLEDAGTYYLGSSSSSNYIFRIVVQEKGGVKSPTVNTVTASSDVTDETGATVTVSFTGKAGDENTTYVVEASKDGEKWIKVGTVNGTATEGSVVVDLCSDKLGFGTWQFRVSGDNEVVASNSITYAPKTYTLSGTYNTGLEDASILTGLTFTATTDSIYTVPEVTIDTTNKTYSVVLEQGTTYTVAGIGVDEYDMITPSGAIKYYEDTTLNLEFNKKVFYNITISLGSTPDLSGKDLVYKFTHADGSVYEFEAGKTIQLRDGVYSVEIGGDFEQMAYTIKTGSSLTVAGADVNHAITFTEKTSWSFASVPNAINTGKTGWFYGIKVDATTGGFKSNGDNCCAYVGAGTILEVPVSGPCTITVTPHSGQAQYALYTINGETASTTESSTTVKYTGEAGTIKIVSTGSAYISGIAVTYPVKDVEYVKQPVMPYVPETDTDAVTDSDTNNIPKGNNAESLTVQPVGQKLTLSQAGGKFGEAFSDITELGYYLFPITADDNKLEFDVVVTASRDTGSYTGFLAGVFTDNHAYTLGLRGGNKIRGLYSKSATGFIGAGSPTEENIGLNRLVHYCITMADTRPTVTVTFVDDDGVTQTRSWSQNPVAEPDGNTPTEFYFGFLIANVDVTVTNMVYTSGDGKKVYYDQNDCYYTEGTAPVASNVTATPSETREYVDITWTGTVPEYDGTYVVEMQKDGGDWVELTQDVTGFSYRYVLPAGDGGNYKFRVCGQLGKESLGGTRNSWATMSSTIYVKGALEKPVVELDVKDGKILVTWQEIAGAEYYKLYRYSSDQGAENAVCVAEKLTTNAYTDSDVKEDVPYYYYVKAVTDSDDNESPLSEVVWTVVASEREGDYVYENEATKITVTKKSYDTVFKNKVVLEGVVYGKGTLTAYVNGVKATSKEVDARDKFAFELTIAAGRNDVNLLFEDKDGNITRETFNFVYLTNYDMVVDASYEGTDGELVNGIPTYKTVQAAVDAAGKAKSSDRVVILVLAGSYEERLVVNTANITLIGEDRENTLIHFYPGVLGEAYEAGGDMDKRCATYIQSGATGFTAENITFANDYVYGTLNKGNESADAIRVEADNSVFVNVGFEGVQDTLYMDAGKQYYYKCVIKGLIDFIYSGEKARSYFNDCEIIFVYEATKNSGYVCAPKTAADATYGLTFNNCTITAEEGCTGAGYLLARPWGADAYITWINCYMGEVINKYAPYSAMSGNMAEDARFYECGTYGPGYYINEARRQISPAQAAAMISADYLGWDPVATTTTLSTANYVGTVETTRDSLYATTEAVEDEYLWTDGDDTGLKMYDQEGYADAYGVTGGGLLLETNDNYYKVDTAEEFLDALLAAKTNRQNTVIELTADINLGCNEVKNFDSYSAVIKAYKNQPLTHPTLIETGVSQIAFEEISNITIFSLNGASIKHANITMKKSENVIIRNIKFDELWEWDEDTNGDYDRNDWDYMTIDSTCDGIWIDHCTFYKAYDGIIDVKNPNPITNVTISWCEFLPGSEDDTFFNVMMDEIKANPDDYPYYQHLLEAGMTEEQVYQYAYFQKKTHLFGQDDTSTNAVGIQVTLANNYYKNSMDRMPRLRYGYSHVYNCVMDSQDILDVRTSIMNEDIAKKLVSNGAASTCGAYVLLENCFINGITNALNSGNGSSPSGYINAINSAYYINGYKQELVPKCNTTGDTRTLVTDADEFIADLPYSDYVLYDAELLRGIVPYYAGAGKLDLTVLQWEKTSYDAEWEDPEIGEIPELPKKGDMDVTVIFMITLLGAAFVTAGFFAKKKFATEE